MAGFGQNIEEIVLSIQTKGQGDLEALKQTLVGVMEKMDGLWGSVARGENVVKNMREINGLARDVKLLETAINGLDPSYRKWIQNADEAGRAVAESFRKQAEAAKEALEEERRVAAEKDRLLSEDIARTLLASQKKDAIAAQAAADADRRLSEDIARASLAAQKADAIRMKTMREAYEAMAYQGFGKGSGFWSSGAIKGTFEDAKEYEKILEKLRRGHETGGESAKRFGYGLLNVAHALQDAQYGFGAVLNNLPLVAQAFGLGPGLAGTVMIAGVGFELLKGHVKTLGRELEILRNPADEAAVSIEQMKDKIAAMVEKPWKIDLDFRSIEAAQKDLDILEARQKALTAAIAKQTPMQQQVGAAVEEAANLLGGAGAEFGGAGNLRNIIGEVAQRTGFVDKLMLEDPRQLDMKMLQEMIDAKVSPMMTAEEQAGVQAARSEGLRRMAILEPQVRETARGRAVSMSFESALRGGPQGLENMLAALATPVGQQLATQGDKARGIVPVDKKLIERLREARPAAFRQRQEDEELAALVDEEHEDKLRRMKEFSQKWRSSRDKEVSDLLSGGKAKALEGTLQEEVLELVRTGADRQAIYEKLIRRTEELMGEGEIGKRAAGALLRQVTERAFAGVIGAKADLPAGATDAMAVQQIMEDRAEAAKVKADKAAAKRLVDPQTGKPFSPEENAAAKALDRQLDEAERLNAQQRKVRNAAVRADDRAGKMEEAQQFEYASRYAMQNYNLNQGQADVAAKRFLKLQEEGVDPFLAEQQAIRELGERNQRMFNPRGRRGQDGLRSIAPIDEEGGGGGTGNGGGLPMAMGAVGAMAQVTDGVVRDQMMFARLQASTMLSLNTVMANQRAMRQQLPTLLASPMPPTPR